MKTLKQYKGLPQQIYYLSFSRIITEMGMMFVFPFMSLLLTRRLGFSTVEAGYIMIILSIGNMLGSLIGGKLSDEIGRKKAYVGLILLIVGAMTAGGFFCNSPVLILFVFISYSSSTALVPAVSAMIVDHSTPENRSECFSLQYLAGNIGCAVGPILAGLLFYRHMQWVFFIQAAFYAAALILVVLKIDDVYITHRETKLEVHSYTRNSTLKEQFLPEMVSHRSILILFLILLSFLTLCYIQMDYTLPLQLGQVYGLDLGSKMSSSIWILNGVIVLVLTPWLILITKRRKPLYNMIFACFLFGVGFGLYGIGVNWLIFLTAPLLWTAGEILITTYSGVLIAELSPVSFRGRGMGLYELARGIGKCIGPVFFSYVITDSGYKAVWIICFFICIACGFGMSLLYRYYLCKSE